ncbi:hypothetical protein HMPREF3293_00253 [Christensenella minuta]|uniref:Uncharacterized protein n=1 Tax=Christensenella minuta TaxID=626937 RepID=A0A136Q868_9FIRM|nr:hypothetical protein HMPREF3293_00253 [Christensenella minuta]
MNTETIQTAHSPVPNSCTACGPAVHALKRQTKNGGTSVLPFYFA